MENYPADTSYFTTAPPWMKWKSQAQLVEPDRNNELNNRIVQSNSAIMMQPVKQEREKQRDLLQTPLEFHH
jgi:hypothetical protein